MPFRHIFKKRRVDIPVRLDEHRLIGVDISPIVFMIVQNILRKPVLFAVRCGCGGLECSHHAVHLVPLRSHELGDSDLGMDGEIERLVALSEANWVVLRPPEVIN